MLREFTTCIVLHFVVSGIANKNSSVFSYNNIAFHLKADILVNVLVMLVP